MLKMVDGTGIIGVDMVCPLGGAVSPPQPNYDKVEVEGVGSLMLPNSLKAPLERVELIGNSVQGENPSPDNPQENRSAGRKSRNLFDITKYDKYDDTWTNTTYTTKKLKLKPNTTYTISCKRLVDKPKQYVIFNIAEGLASGSGIYAQIQPDLSINVFISKGTFMTNDVGEITLSYYVDCPKEQYWFTEVIGDIQIEEGGKENAYEPYSDKYLFDAKVTGKNLFDLMKIKNGFVGNTGNGFSVVQDNRYPSSLYLDTVIYLKAGQTLNISGVVPDTCRIRVKYDTGVYYLKYTANKNVEIMICFYSGLSEDDKRNLMIEISDEPTPYEPYTEQSVQIALNEPLRGIGEYKDTITKDGVIRKIASYEFNLNDLRDGGYEKTNTVMFSVKVQNRTVGYASLKPSIFCNIFPDCALQTSNIYNTDKECIAVGVGIILFRVNKSRLKDTSTFESAKQSFIEFMVDKKMIVEYALETPITEPLPESVQAQLQALHSENGVTHVFVDSGEIPCGIKLAYRKEI